MAITTIYGGRGLQRPQPLRANPAPAEVVRFAREIVCQRAGEIILARPAR